MPQEFYNKVCCKGSTLFGFYIWVPEGLKVGTLEVGIKGCGLKVKVRVLRVSGFGVRGRVSVRRNVTRIKPFAGIGRWGLAINPELELMTCQVPGGIHTIIMKRKP